MKNKLFFYIFFGLIVLLFYIEAANAKIVHNKLDSKRYTDPKGYFKIVPPLNWHSKRIPSDS